MSLFSLVLNRCTLIFKITYSEVNTYGAQHYNYGEVSQLDFLYLHQHFSLEDDT